MRRTGFLQLNLLLSVMLGTFSASPVTQTFLTFAVEIVGDYWGNEDSLCESDERCLFTPNVGAYQGEGELVGPCTFTNSASVRDVLIYAYEQNGAETVIP